LVDCSKRWAKDLESFLKKSKAVDREAARLVSPGDSDEAKLRTLYARVQQIRRKTLEDSLKKSLAPEATVNLLAMEGWQSSEGSLKASFEVEIPNFASRAGRRLVLPLAVFHANQRNPFVTKKRANPIDFSYPREDREAVKIELPDGMQLESPPSSSKSDQNAAYYEFSVSSEGKTLRLSRTMRFHAYLFLPKDYAAIQVFYNRVFVGDSQQITLIPRTEHASK